MPGREVCGRRPSWRRHHTLNRQKARIVGLVDHKIKKHHDQSRYVYENKQNSGKMPGERLDIYIKLTCFLQKIAGFDGQFARNGAFTACGMRKFSPKVGNAIGRKRPDGRCAVRSVKAIGDDPPPSWCSRAGLIRRQAVHQHVNGFGAGCAAPFSLLRYPQIPRRNQFPTAAPPVLHRVAPRAAQNGLGLTYPDAVLSLSLIAVLLKWAPQYIAWWEE
jgi:hypothetical protein